MLLITRTPRHIGIGFAYHYARDVDALFVEFVEKGADSQDEPIGRPWGLREITVLDAKETVSCRAHIRVSWPTAIRGRNDMTGAEPLGLKHREVVVVPYDARWPVLFEAASAELVDALGSSILAVHHVGSTSVPGLCAKPVLDLLVSVPDLHAATNLIPDIESIGYEFRPDEDIPDRHFLRRRVGAVRTHHLSLAEPTSRHHRVTLAFRDALRREPQLAASYSDLKLALALQFPHDRPAYLEGKSKFIGDVLASLRQV